MLLQLADVCGDYAAIAASTKLVETEGEFVTSLAARSFVHELQGLLHCKLALARTRQAYQLLGVLQESMSKEVAAFIVSLAQRLANHGTSVVVRCHVGDVLLEDGSDACDHIGGTELQHVLHHIIAVHV